MLRNKLNLKIVQDEDKTISVMHGAGKWLKDSGRKPSESWQPQNMNKDYLLKHAESSEFYAALIDGKPVAGMILQDNQRNQSWKSVDKDKKIVALYVHWLCVDHEYAGKGLPGVMIDFAAKFAKTKGIHILRLDTNAEEPKLRRIYEELGFNLRSTEKEGNHVTAFYEKEC